MCTHIKGGHHITVINRHSWFSLALLRAVWGVSIMELPPSCYTINGLITQGTCNNIWYAWNNIQKILTVCLLHVLLYILESTCIQSHTDIHAIYMFIICYRSCYCISWHYIIGYHMLHPPSSESACLWATLILILIWMSTVCSILILDSFYDFMMVI